jgi:hypothetical protein
LEVAIGEIGEHVEIDLVFSKLFLVSAEAETAKPTADIHGRASHGLVGQWFSCGNVSSGAVGAPANEEIEGRFGRSDPLGRPLRNGRLWPDRHLQPKAAFSRFAFVHRADLKGQQRVDCVL